MTSYKTEILLNPRLPETERKKAYQLPMDGPFLGHVWLATSGTTSQNRETKYAALSRKALLASAEAVNSHLQSSSKDVWINPLPHFHVGGLGIYARGYLSGAKVIPFPDKWDPHAYCEVIRNNGGTLSSLVPTQVYDLVQANLRSPECLRAIVVGGGRLSEPLYSRALELGWKLLPSYGMTEAGSQVATADIADIGNPALKILPHLSLEISKEGYIRLCGTSLFTCYGYVTEHHCRIEDPKVGGWFAAEDRGEVRGEALHVHGRKVDFIKVGGESVDMGKLEQILNEIIFGFGILSDAALVAVSDERLGQAVHLAVEKMEKGNVDALVREFNKRVLPFERIRRVHVVDLLPRSPLKKLLRRELLAQIV